MWLPGGEEREWDAWGIGGWWMKIVILEIIAKLGPTVQHRELCITESNCYTTDIEEILKINYILMKKRLNTINRTRYRKDKGVRIFKKEFENSRLIC